MEILKALTVFAAAMLIPLSGWAKTTPSSDLMNLVYYPHDGVFEINPRVSVSVYDRSSNSLNTSTSTSTTTIFAVVQYGLPANFRIGLQESLLWDQTVITTGPAGNQSDSNSAGPSSPTISAGWRYYEDSRSEFSGDLSAAVTPSLDTRLEGNGAQGKLGNNMSGGWTAEVAASFYWYQRNNEIKLMPELTRNFQSRTLTGTPANDYVTSNYWSELITVADRLHFNSSYFLQGSLSYNFQHNSNQSLNSGVTKNISDAGYLSGRIDFGFQPEHDIVLDLSLTASERSTDTVSSAAGIDNQTKNTAITAVWELFYQFR